MSNHPDLYPYQVPKLTLLQTDVMETELLFRKMSLDKLSKMNAHPEMDNRYVFYRLKYEKPEDDFTGLRKLILAIRHKTGMRSSYQGIVGIDITAWKGHESEEYFQIFEKYIYDNCDDWKLVFICSNYSDQEFAELQYHCVNYFVIERRQAYIYETDHLNRCIKDTISSFGANAEEKGIQRLEEILRSESMNDYRSVQMIKRIVYELCLSVSECQEKNLITDRSVQAYMEKPSSVLNILTGRSFVGGSNGYKEAV